VFPGWTSINLYLLDKLLYGKPKGTILRGIEMLAMLAILFILFGDHLTPLIASEDSLLTRYGKLSYISLFIP
jgi:hypothetical protein